MTEPRPLDPRCLYGASVPPTQRRENRRRPGRALLGLLAVTLLGLLLSTPVGAAEAPLSQRFQVTTNGNIEIIGNAIVTCDTSDPACVTALASGQPSNSWAMSHIDVDGDGTTFNSSSADLTLPANAEVLFARLYWAGTTQGSVAPPNVANRTQIRFSTPASGGYQSLSGTLLGDTTTDDDSYGASVDVTALVKAGGSGTYTLADQQVSTGTGSTGPWGGWSLAVAYAEPGEGCHHLSVFDGYENFFFATETVTINGLQTPSSGTVDATLGFFMGDGDRQNTNPDDANDVLTFAGTTLSNANNPADNFFNNTITEFGTFVSTRSPNTDHTLVVDIDKVDASGILAAGANSASISVSSTEGLWWPLLTVAIESQCPTLSVSKTSSATGDVQPGETFSYTVEVSNAGPGTAHQVVIADPLPAGLNYVATSAQKTYWVDVTSSGSFTQSLGAATFDAAGLTQSFDTTGSIPTGADLTSYSLSTTGTSNDWLSDIALTATYPGGTAYTLAAGTFGGDGSGSWNQTRGPGAFGGTAEGPYQFVWSDGFDGVAGDDNAITTASFTIQYTYPSGRSSTTDAAGAPPNLVTAANGISLEPGETMSVTFQVTVDDPLAQNIVQFENVASISADEVPIAMTASATDGAANGADLSILKTLDTPGPFVRGQTVTYSLSVSNAGPLAATSVTVTDTPTHLTITGVSGSGCASLPCVIPTIPVGGTAVITVTATVE